MDPQRFRLDVGGCGEPFVLSPPPEYDPDGSLLLRAGNIHPKDAHFVVDESPWNNLWSEWDHDGWIEPQIRLARDRFGVNAIRIIGSFTAADELGIDEYNARWVELVETCRNLGVYLYPCAGSLSDMGDRSTAEQTAIVSSWGAVMDEYTTVIGIDVTNEWRGAGPAAGLSGAESWAAAETLTAAFRAVTTKPLALSDFANETAIAADFEWAEQSASIVDWIDLHVYYSSGAPALGDWDAITGSAWAAGKPIVVGEFGVESTESDAYRTAYVEGVRDVVAEVDAFGSFIWAIRNDAFGLVNGSGVTQDELADPFKTFPTART